MRVLAVGDLHTKLWIVEAVKRIVDDYDAIVFIGDYADDWGKGPVATIDIWKAVYDLQREHPDKVKVLMGNHDYGYVNHTKSISGGYNPIVQVLLYTPENKRLRRWLSELPVEMVIDGVTYSHAGVTEEWENSSDRANLWSDESPLWARPYDYTYKDFPQVFGHTPSNTCWEIQPNVWCIDTFSTLPDGDFIGDCTVLEIIDGKKFNKKELAV